MRCSSYDKELGRFLLSHRYCIEPDFHDTADCLYWYKELVVNAHPTQQGRVHEQVMELLKYQGHVNLLEPMQQWSIPTFPVSLWDLRQHGLMGSERWLRGHLRELKEQWRCSRYSLTREELIEDGFRSGLFYRWWKKRRNVFRINVGWVLCRYSLEYVSSERLADVSSFSADLCSAKLDLISFPLLLGSSLSVQMESIWDSVAEDSRGYSISKSALCSLESFVRRIKTNFTSLFFFVPFSWQHVSMRSFWSGSRHPDLHRSLVDDRLADPRLMPIRYYLWL